MHDPKVDVAELLDDVFADFEAGAALPLAELEPAQIEAWVSNLLAAWRTDLAVSDPTEVDRDLLRRCATAETTEALLICRAVAALAPASAPAATTTVSALAAAGVGEPAVGSAIGSEQATDAWVVEPVTGRGQGREAAVIVGFIHPDSSEHVLLADLTIAGDGSERLAGLRLDGPAESVIGADIVDAGRGIIGAAAGDQSNVDDDDHALVDDETIDDDAIDDETTEGQAVEVSLRATAVAPDIALRRIAAAWEASINGLPPIEPDALDLLVVNQLVAAARLRSTLGADAPPFLQSVDERPLLGAAPRPSSGNDGSLDPETAAANAVSLRTLQGALRSHRPQEAPIAMVEAVASTIAGSVSGLAADEAEAVGFLEWADWLGVLIGLVRLGPGATVAPGSLVDLINRCPEVSSTIPKADRSYVEFAFSVVLDVWRQTGVVLGDQLTADGYHSLYPAAVQIWSTRH